MSHPTISPALRRRVAVWARQRCCYCLTQVEVIGDALEIDHIVPLYAGGKTEESNLCLACSSCNQAKGIQTEAMDPVTGKTVSLFHPRTQNWSDHFQWSQDGVTIIG